MRKVLLLALVLLIGWPSPGFAWGYAAHRLIMARAIEALPPEIKPFFQRHQSELLLRVADPDLWREAGWEDDPNHFLNLGVREYGAYPFAALPKEYGAAIEKFGMDTLRRNGLLPWRFAEEFGNLRRAFAGGGRSGSDRADTGSVVLFAAVAAHYIQDACQPLHATGNFDGQDSGNRGIHARFERDLITRFESRLSMALPSRVRPMSSPRDAAFEALLASHQMVEPILKADTEAAGGRRTYDQPYFDRLFTRVKPIIEERLSAAALATASMIVGAWEAAGSPRL